MDEKPTNGKRRLTAEEQEQFTAGVRKAEAIAAQMKALSATSLSESQIDKINSLNEELAKVLDSVEHLAPFAE